MPVGPRISASGDWRVEHHAELDSTNRYALDAARKGAAAGLVVTAAHQTAGRGRLDRTWEAPPGSSLLVSVLLRPEGGPESAHAVVVAAAVALAAAVRAVAVADADIKGQAHDASYTLERLVLTVAGLRDGR